MTDLASCQCRRVDGLPCERPMSAEDLLCDQCRNSSTCLSVSFGATRKHLSVASETLMLPDWCSW